MRPSEVSRVGATLATIRSSPRRGDPCGRPKLSTEESAMKFYSRKNIRLPGYDYSQEGGYFVTVCTHNRKCTLSRILLGDECERATVELTQLGELVETVLKESAEQYRVKVDSYVIMPNHIHAILFLKGNEGGTPITVGRFVGTVKSIIASRWLKQYRRRGSIMGSLWQRNYYEHILRNEQDYLEKRTYIERNPDQGRIDEEYAEYGEI